MLPNFRNLAWFERAPHLIEAEQLDLGLSWKARNYEVNPVPASFLVGADEGEDTAVQSLVEIGR
jgi:hypothetical protein